MVFILIKCFFPLFKDILRVDLFDTEGLSMSSLYHTPSAKQQRSGTPFAEKTCSDKTEQFTPYVLSSSFARHHLTSFPDEN